MTLPRLGFHLKHTLIRTAIKNGAVFEIGYVGALGGESDPVLVDAGAAETGTSAKRNWWAAAREVVRVTKGKSIIVSSGVGNDSDLRAPRDVANLYILPFCHKSGGLTNSLGRITLLGLPQDASHGCLTAVPKSVVFRACLFFLSLLVACANEILYTATRKTYRAVLSEPRLVIPEGFSVGPTQDSPAPLPAPAAATAAVAEDTTISTPSIPEAGGGGTNQQAQKKRPRDEAGGENSSGGKKKKRKKNNNNAPDQGK